MLKTAAATLGFVTLMSVSASALTCADQHQACLLRGHTTADCTKSTNACLKTGRWIGPAGREYPITKKQ